MGTVRTCPLLVPVTVSEYVPAATFFLVSSINVVVPDVVTELGENRAVTNFGNALIENVTVPVNPVPGSNETTYDAVAPLETVWVACAREIAKLPETTSVTFVLLVIGPLAALIVSV